MAVGLVGLGSEVPFARELASAVKKEFKVEAKVLGVVPLDGKALEPSRGQYDAERLLKGLGGEWLSNWGEWGKFGKVLGVASVDLFVPGMTFVFGLSVLGGRSGVVSTARLKGDKGKLRLRLVKEVLHEIGHLFGLRHCENEKCVMWFSDSIAEVDKKKAGLCAECRKKLKPL